MKLKNVLSTFVLICLFAPETIAQIHLISAKRMSVDARYDSLPNESMAAVLAGYKSQMGEGFNRQIGECAQFMTVEKPEGLLSDFLADQLCLKANQWMPDGVDFSIINLGSIRAPLKKGILTVTDIYKVMPFDDELVILELKGSDVRSVFKNIAREVAVGVSNVSLVIRATQVSSLLIGGNELQEDKIYRIATLDFLADGASGMSAFLHAVKRTDTGLKIRDVYMEQIEKLTAQGKKVDACLDGRIKWINQ